MSVETSFAARRAIMPREKEKKRKKTPGTKKVRKATKKQRQNRISKSGNPTDAENKRTIFPFLRS
jgi:hypothetical protein